MAAKRRTVLRGRPMLCSMPAQLPNCDVLRPPMRVASAFRAQLSAVAGAKAQKLIVVLVNSCAGGGRGRGRP